MIMEYHKSQGGPLIDPTTGAVKAEKYYPSTFAYDVTQAQALPPLKDDVILGYPATEADIQHYNDIKSVLLHVELPKAENEYKILLDELAALEDVLNYGKIGISPTAPRTALTSAEKTALEADIAATHLEIDTKKAEIKAIYEDADDATQNIKKFKQNIKDNKNVVIQHNKDIKDNIRLFKENLMANNANKIYMEQQPNESDDDFLQRMKDIESEQFDINMYADKGNMDQIIRLKNNLKEVIRSDQLIENITKSFSPDQIFIINKHFIEIKDNMLETYGFDNKNLSTSDLVEIITNVLERILNPPLEYEIKDDPSVVPPSGETVPISTLTYNDPSSGILVATDFRFGTDTNSLYIENTAINRHVYFKVGEKERKLIFFSKNLNSEGNFIAVVQRGIRAETVNGILFDYLKLDNIAQQEIFKGSKKFTEYYDTLLNDYKLIPLTEIKSKKLPTSSSLHKRWGWGISHPEETIPSYGQF